MYSNVSKYVTIAAPGTGILSTVFDGRFAEESGTSMAAPHVAGAIALLRQEFPELPFVHLKGYAVHYSKNKWTLPFVLATQIPKILSVIQYENQRLKELVKEHAIDAVISDSVLPPDLTI